MSATIALIGFVIAFLSAKEQNDKMVFIGIIIFALGCVSKCCSEIDKENEINSYTISEAKSLQVDTTYVITNTDTLKLYNIKYTK